MHSVLLPHDLSSDDGLVVRFVSGLKALGTRRVVLMHALNAAGVEGPVILHKIEETLDRLREVAAPLEEAGIRTEVRVPTGDPYREVVSVAAETGVSAIVCGTRAKKALSELIVGSVSERVARDARIPTLMVRYALLSNVSDPAEMGRRFGEKLVVPTDFSSTATHGVETALDLPAKAVSSAYLLHVLDAATGEEARKGAESVTEARLSEWVDIARERGITAVPVIRYGDAWREVLAEIDDRRATGVVIGTRGRGALQEALMGNLAMTLLRQASCPVMIVP